jgi:hypothetical protein
MFYFTKHLIEAIVVNTFRMIPYAVLSKGASLKVSILLITSEFVTLPSSLIFDFIAIYFNLKKIPFLKFEFIEMSKISIVSQVMWNKTS